MSGCGLTSARNSIRARWSSFQMGWRLDWRRAKALRAKPAAETIAAGELLAAGGAGSRAEATVERTLDGAVENR
jgi:hypothetical protein